MEVSHAVRKMVREVGVSVLWRREGTKKEKKEEMGFLRVDLVWKMSVVLGLIGDF